MKRFRKVGFAALKVLLVAAFFLQCMDFFALQPSATSEVITGVVDINTSRYATYILLQDKRTLLTAGYNDSRKLARPELANNADAKFGTADTSMVQGEIQSISVSQTNGILVDDYGNVYVVGQHDYSQFADGSSDNRNEAKFLKIDVSPITNAGAKAVKGYAGYHYIIVLDDQGNVWGAGDNGDGELGLGTTGEINRLTKIPNVANVIDVQTTPDAEGGLTATAILQADGRVFVSGNNSAGSFGLGNTTTQRSFVQYPITDIKQINMSNYNIMVLTNGGELYASGDNQWGMFGNGSNVANFNTPQNISAKLRASTIGGSTRSWNVEKILPSQTAAWLQLDDGTVWAAGTNNGSWGDLGYRFTTRTTNCGAENECWFHDVSDPVAWDQEANRGAVVYKSDEASSGFDISYPSAFAGTWEGGILIDKEGTLLIVGNSNHGELGVAYAANPKATLFKPIQVERFIFNPVLDFYEGETKLANTDTIVDPTSIVVGPKQWDTAEGAPEVQAYWKVYKTSTPNTTIKSGNSVITDNTLTLTVSNLKLPPEDYTIEVYRKTTDGKLTSTTIAKNFKLTTPLSTPVINADNMIIQKGSTFDPMTGVTGIDEFRDDVTSSVSVASNNVNTNQIGSYTVTYSMVTTLGTAVGKSRTVTVVDSDSVYDETSVLRANGWVMQSSEVAGLNDAQLISKGSAKAWTMATNAALPITIARNEITETPGTYQVEYTAAELSKTVYVTVTNDNTVIDDTTALYANRFIINKKDVAGISDANIISRAGARAWLTADASSVEVSVDDNQMQAAVGTYDVRFKANAVTNTVKAVVIDDQTVYDDVTALRADNFIVTVDEAAALNNAAILTNSNAKAWLMADGSNVTPTIASNGIQAQAGVYPVQLQANNVTKTIYVTVKDENTVIDEDKDTALYATSFTIDTAEVAGLSDAKVNTLAGAKAWKLSDGSSVSFTTDFAAIEAEAGVYPVTFATANGVSRTVYATVKDENTTIDDNKDTAIYAKSFVLDKADVAGLTGAKVNTLAGARAWKLSDGSAISFTTNFSAIKAEAGVYPVTFTTPSGVSRTVYATVKDEDTVIDEDKNTALYAHNFIIDKAGVASLTDASVTTLAGAKAWKLSDGSAVGVTVDYGQIQAVPGSYPVTFTSSTGVSKTVQATVKDENTVIDDDKDTALFATDFSIDKSDVAELTKDSVKTLAAAKAWQLSDGVDISSEIAVDYSAIVAVEGSYNVVFTVNGVSRTVKANVGDKSVIESVAIDADNFVIDSRQVAELTDASVKTQANASAIGTRRDGQTVDMTSQLTVDYSAVKAQVGSYPATFSLQGESKTIYVTVKDEDTIIDDNKDSALRAKSFTIAVGDVEDITFEEINQLAGAKAWKLSDGTAVGYSTDFSALKAEVGVYPIKFETTTGVKKTVYATVTDEDTVIDDEKDTALYAHNFIIDKADVAGLNEASVVSKTGAKAWKLSDGSSVSFTTNFAAIKAEAGVYPVTFETTTGVKKTIYATVKDENTVIDEDKDAAVYAKSFVINTSDVAGLTDVSVTNLASAKAWKLSDGSSLGLTVDRSAIKAQVGVYPVSFTTANGVSKTVYATVKDSDTVIDEDKDTALYAHNFTIAKDDVVGLSFTDINTLAGARAWYISNGNAMGFSTNYSALKAEVGVYPIIFTTDTGITKTVYATVTDENTTIDENKDTAIHAKSFVIDSADVAGLTNTKVTTLADAKAWKLSDGSAVSFIVDYSAIKAEAGAYPVTFTTTTGVSRTVYATVKNSDTIIDDEKDTALHAKSFAIAASEVEDITFTEINALAGAKAWKISDGSAVGFSTDFTALKAEAGVYPVTFTTTTGITKTVYASVYDEDTVIDENKDTALYAHNFIIDKADVAGLNETGVVSKAGAKAWKLSDGASVSFTTDFAAVKAEAGVYPVTFTTSNGVTKTVYATVKDENTVIDEDKDTAIYAHSFKVAQTDVAGLTSAKVTTLAEAKAWKLSDGSVATFTVDYSAVANIAGVYPVTFTTTTGASKTVYATVYDDDTVIDEDKNTAIYATDFGLDVSEVAELDDDAVKSLAAAKAWQLTDGVDLTGSLVVDYSAIKATVGTYNVTFTVNDVTRTVVATVSDKTTIVSTAVTASNFILNSNEVAGLSNASVKTLANAHATGTQADSQSVDLTTSLNVDYSAITATPGNYPVTFSLNGESVTVQATVKDENTVINKDEDTAIYAKSFVIDTTEVADLDEAAVISKAGAKAWQLSDGAAVSFTTDYSAIQAEAGVYPVTFTTETDVTRTVYATVKDDNTIIDENKDTALYAHNFIVAAADVADLDETGVVNLAGAKAWKLSDGTSASFTTDFAALQAEAGVYPVSFETESGVSKTVYATVTDENTIIDEDKDTALYAHNFIIDVDDAAGLDDAAVTSLAGAKAWKLSDGSALDFTIDFSAIKAEAGVYPVTFATEDGVSKTVYATVKDANTTIDEDKDSAIYALNFNLDVSEVADLDAESAKTLAAAKAWQLSNGADLTGSLVVDYSAIKAEVGSYNVTFTVNGVSRTVVAKVSDKTTIVSTAITASNFIIDINEVAGLSKDSVKTLASAHATGTQADSTTVDLTTALNVDYSAVVEALGSYPVTFSLNGESVTIYATVKDANTIIDEDKDTALAAHSFVVAKADVADLNEAGVIGLAGAKAWKLTDGTSVSFTTDFAAIKAEAGVYPVTFTTSTGISKTVYATVTDEDTIIDEDKDTALYAHNFIVDASDVATFDEAAVNGLAGAKAWKLSDGSSIDFTTNFSAIKAEAGVYPVIFTTSTGVSKTVYATVKDADTIIDEDKDTALYAKSFTLPLADVEDISYQDINILAGAKAWQLSDGSAVGYSTDFTALQAEVGVYPISFTTTSGVSKTVYATVYDENTIIDEDKDTALYARNFIIDAADVAGLNEASVVGMAGAKAWKLTDGTSVSFTTDFAAIKAEAGVYPVVFTTSTGVSRTVYATVKDADTIIDEDKDTALYAHNFIVAVSDVAALDDAAVNGLAGAKAWQLSDGSSIDFSTNFSAIKAEAGVYPVTFTTETGVSKTVYATVKDENTIIDEDKDTAIFATNFSIDVSEVAGLDEAAVKTLAAAKAWQLSDGTDATADLAVDYSAIKAEVGTYNVTFSVNGVSRTVVATVSDKTTIVSTVIDADNFIVTASDVAGLTDNSVKTLANAHATGTQEDTTIVDLTTMMAVDYSAITTTPGSYPVTFSLNGESKTVYATVKDANTVIDEDKDTALHAKSFVMDKADVAGLDEAAVIALAEAKAWQLSDGAPVSFTTDYSTITAEAGVYPVTFTTSTGVSKTVYATVKDENTSIDEDKDTAIYAHNFIIDTADVAGLNEASVVSMAGAKAWKLTDGTSVSFTTDFAAIKAEAGVYPVIFTTSTGVSRTVYATVKDEDTTIDEDKDTAIYAKDFALDISDVTGLNADSVKTLAAAKAWLLSDGSDLSGSLVVDYSAIQAVVGTYNVIFTVNGVTRTVTATVSDKTTIVSTTIAAENFTIDLADVAALNNDSVKSLANASATGTQADSVTVDLTASLAVDYSAVIESLGSYPVTFSVNGESKTVYATVKDENTIIDDNKDTALSAKSFIIADTDVAGLDDAAVTSLAEAKAWKLSDGSAASFTVDFSAIEEAAGAYPVTFTTETGVSKTVYATVKNENTVIDEDKDVAIFAIDFSIEQSLVSGLSTSTVKSSAGAKAWKLSDGTDITASLAVDFSVIVASEGTYPVTFSVNGVSRTVNATVWDKTVITSVDLTAHNFVMTKDEVAGLDQADAISRAGANATGVRRDLLNVDLCDDIVADISAVQAVPGAYPVTFEADGESVTVYVTVTDDNTIIDEDKDTAIYAKDFAIDKSEVATLDADSVKTLAAAQAWLLSDGSDISDQLTVDYSAILAEEGTYSVDFTVNGVTRTITVTVGDKTVIDTVSLNANNFIITTDEVSSLTADSVKAQAQLSAIGTQRDGVTVDLTADTTADYSAVAAVPGAYPVSFAVHGTTKTVYVSVTDENTVIDEDKDTAIYAKGFTILVNDAAKLTDAAIISKAGAKAWLLSDGSSVNVNIADNQIKAEVGSYQVTFAANGVAKTVMVHVIDSETVLDDNSALRANGFTIHIDDVATLDDTAIIEQANAKAWSLTDGSSLPVTITTNEIVAVLGSYTVVFEADGLSKSVRVNVIDDATVIGDTTAIRAEGFTVHVDDVATLDDATILAQANAKAWLLADNSDVAINITANAVRAEVGGYAVTLQANEVTKTIIVTVIDENTEIISGVAIHAKSFALKEGEVSSLTDAQVKQLAGLKAWDIVTGVYLTDQVKPDYTAIQPVCGFDYDVHFTLTRQRPTAKGFVTNDISVSTRTVKATVLEDDAVEPSPSLPTTGENSFEIMTVGLAAIGIALGAIGAYRKTKKRK